MEGDQQGTRVVVAQVPLADVTGKLVDVACLAEQLCRRCLRAEACRI
jgi:hypothetical protein